MSQPSGEIAGGQVLSAFGSSLNAYIARFADDIGMEKECGADPASLGALLASGQFLLQSAPGNLTEEMCRRAAADLLGLLRENIPHLRPEVDRLAQAFAAGQTNEQLFLRFALANEGNALMQFCRKFELQEDLLLLFAVLFARPFRGRAARSLASKIDLLVWNRGYCPVCGHWPSLAHIDDHQGLRTLWCMQCGMLWPYPRLKCVFCFHDCQDQLEILHPEGERNLRVQACRSCRRYIKEVRIQQAAAEFPFDAVYLGTGSLDLMAIKEGYFQESALAVRDVHRDEIRTDQPKVH